MNFQAIDAAISDAAKQSFANHLWYLCPEMIVLALFDQGTSRGQKMVIASELLRHPRAAPANFAPGRPGGRRFEQVLYFNDYADVMYLYLF